MICIPGATSEDLRFMIAETEINGEPITLFMAEGVPEGVSVATADLNSGKITEQSIINRLSQVWLDRQGD